MSPVVLPPSSRRALAALAALLLSGVAVSHWGGWEVGQGVASSRATLHASAAPKSEVCTLRAYTPSAWEDEWVGRLDAIYGQDAICPVMHQFSALSDDWLAGVAACKQAPACGSVLSTRVFSTFVKECAVGGRSKAVTVVEYIEPLVGHMRHPHALPACAKPGSRPVNIQDRSYLLLLGDASSAIRARRPGRAILVDAGTNTYGSSLGYLVPAYAAAGIHFDAIYAWERKPLNGSEYWATVPDDVKPRLHFYNAAVTPAAGSAMNPVDWIKNMHRPGDFIVFKLDIDNDDVESALIQQVMDLDGAGDMIAEMFFEKHYTATDMMPHFKKTHTEYPAAVRLMQALRVKGVRAHYWP